MDEVAMRIWTSRIRIRGALYLSRLKLRAFSDDSGSRV